VGFLHSLYNFVCPELDNQYHCSSLNEIHKLHHRQQY
jgi:hypothetical protein